MSLQKPIKRLSRLIYNLRCKLPFIQAQQLLAGYEDLQPRVPIVSTHWETASLFDHLLIGSIVSALRPRVCFEIGTSLGLVTSTIARNSPQGTRVHTLDMSPDKRIGSYFADLPESAKIERHVCSSTEFDFDPIGEVDFFFIDGSHEFDHVRSDTENALRLLSSRGVIVWHDVNAYFPEVGRALEHSPIAGRIQRIYGTACAVHAAPDAPFPLNRSAAHSSLANLSEAIV